MASETEVDLSSTDPIPGLIGKEGKDLITRVGVATFFNGRTALIVTSFIEKLPADSAIPNAVLSRVTANYLTDEERIALGKALLAPELAKLDQGLAEALKSI